MLARNFALRSVSLVFSVLIVLYIRRYSGDAYSVSTNIMLSTLLFSILKAGFSFDRLVDSQSDAKALSVITPDKVILIVFSYAFSRYLGVDFSSYVYALFSAAVVSVLFVSQYTRFTEGHLMPAVVVAFIFPTQAILNLMLDHYAPGIFVGLAGVMVVLFFLFDKFVFGMQRMARAELYYTVLLPAGALSAISIEGIDRPLYLLFSKVVDSGGSVASFLIQGNLKVTRAWARQRGVYAMFRVGAIVTFMTGCLLLAFMPAGMRLMLAAVLLVNLVWLIYSLLMLVRLVGDGSIAVDMLLFQAGFWFLGVAGLYFTGLLQPLYIVLALSLSLVFSMMVSTRKPGVFRC